MNGPAHLTLTLLLSTTEREDVCQMWFSFINIFFINMVLTFAYPG